MTDATPPPSPATGPVQCRATRFGAKDIAVILLMNVMWGLNIIAVKSAIDLVPPMTAGFLRQAVVLAVCATSLRWVPGKMRDVLTVAVLSGCLFFVPLNLSFLVSDNVGALAIAGQLGVPFSMILAVIFLGERIRLPRIMGIVLAMGGVGLMLFDPAAAREGPGLALTVLASLVWSVSSLIQRQLRGVPVLTLYGWMGLCGAVGMGTIALVVEPQAMRSIGALPLSVMGWIIFSAIGSTLMGHGAMSWLLQRHPISAVTPLTLGAPVISVFAGAWYFSTPLTALMLAGGAVAMAGVAIVTIRTARKGEAT